MQTNTPPPFGSFPPPGAFPPPQFMPPNMTQAPPKPPDGELTLSYFIIDPKTPLVTL